MKPEIKNNLSANASQSQLLWACRRGMLELDLLLAPFVKGRYLELDPAAQAAFRELLSIADPDLFQWLLGQGSPELHLQAIVNEVRLYAQTRLSP